MNHEHESQPAADVIRRMAGDGDHVLLQPLPVPPDGTIVGVIRRGTEPYLELAPGVALTASGWVLLVGGKPSKGI